MLTAPDGKAERDVSLVAGYPLSCAYSRLAAARSVSTGLFARVGRAYCMPSLGLLMQNPMRRLRLLTICKLRTVCIYCCAPASAPLGGREGWICLFHTV